MDVMIKKIYIKKFFYFLLFLIFAAMLAFFNYVSNLENYTDSMNIPYLKKKIIEQKRVLQILNRDYNNLLPKYKHFVGNALSSKEIESVENLMKSLFLVLQKKAIIEYTPVLQNTAYSYKYLNVIVLNVKTETLKDALILKAVLPYIFNSFNISYKIKTVKVDDKNKIVRIEIYKSPFKRKKDVKN